MHFRPTARAAALNDFIVKPKKRNPHHHHHQQQHNHRQKTSDINDNDLVRELPQKTSGINDNDLVRELRQKLKGRNLRDVIIDGANIGRTYNFNSRCFFFLNKSFYSDMEIQNFLHVVLN